MNYQHSYHAGNFADVLKHVVMIAILTELQKKGTAYCFMDTHAGAGHYDLLAGSAAKNKEFLDGINKILHEPNPPVLIQLYLECVSALNHPSSDKLSALNYYPGSPLIAQYFARSIDCLIACELQPTVCQTLRQSLLVSPKVSIHCLDGYLGLKAFLPPKERRGLVLIDPPYEDPDEFTKLDQSITIALKRFQTGIFEIWYPVKNRKQVNNFLLRLRKMVSRTILIVELNLYPELGFELSGCGVAIVNPPQHLKETLALNLPWMWGALAHKGQGGCQLYPL